MKVALIGVSGLVGSRLLAELLRRGHEVTGIARDTRGVAARPHLLLKNGDATRPAQLAPLLAGHDATISATKFATSDAAALIAAMKQAGVPRLLVVGGAGSLEMAPGQALIDTPGFPAAYKPEAEAGRHFLDTLRKEPHLDWTFLSPSAEFVPGDRTGRFRLGGDMLLTDANGHSWISMEDFAIAMVDELEASKHSRQRFTVGY
ncbi:3-beta hydroxysteroid dehydrogenase [Rhodanobacter sp. FW510-R12]|uniref:NAD(P)-dependent oxidoreductase n=1 Tax=unclassified Rhodanobacter TaxID=2621553 RepID=UPI0007A9B4D0|nr:MULTISPECIES: NAD(P)-dependent oxidoreductase [unclassified Rhodanobacter]KZC16634.1 3-beta hydroxysteroid dehydrogenase [Rhodanobacter sp. FW104-R8]KZC27505.1 3-beta hydroxysteroid dehydrogenase [Rhodanobacter sp. FW510-T8]KZC31854.1 3-beta hydroxysteroid dehydrogenase [Rhodanobacter sp. FW510-R10]